ncbi:HNH endonuclease [Myxococcus xanthus]|uniref:HNH endonuclease n=1 Tax=Myxococcus xanthus TaxID=34 RepID=UPI0011294F4B
MTRPITWRPNHALTPGEQLHRWLVTRYPITPRKENLWIDTIASDFNLHSLEATIHQSTTLMLLRRLITNAEWYRRQHLEKFETRFENDYLRHHLSFPPQEARAVSNLTFKALEASKQNIPLSTIKKIKTKGEQRNTHCELCGEHINYHSSNPNDDSRFSLDHIWPRSLGGHSDESNLRITHIKCNSFRQDYASAADTHYEHLHVKVPEGDPSFLLEANRMFRLAINYQSGFQCSRCERPLSRLPDGLRLEVRSRHESHNFFNSMAICIECKR